MTFDKTGMFVKYYDSHSIVHDALINADWNKTGWGAVNLVYVNQDPSMQDQYGQQLLRATSVAHIKQGGGYEKLMANCWCTYAEYINEFVNKKPERS